MHLVQLTYQQNLLLASGMRSLVHSLNGDAERAMVALFDGRRIMQAMGPEGLKVLAASMEAHATNAKNDGTVA